MVFVMSLGYFVTPALLGGTANMMLAELVALAAKPVKPRKATQPTFSARMQRVNSKVLRGQIKAARGKVTDT